MKLIVIFLVLAFAGLSFADANCAVEHYEKSCSSCSFDEENGKMDETCYDKHEGDATSCIVANYPMAVISSTKEKCPYFAKCSLDLSACKNRLTSGNDKTDCETGQLRQCFVDADQCAFSAAEDCEEEYGICHGMVFILAILGGTLFYRRQNKA